MPTLHPTPPVPHPLTPGASRERDMLRLLEDALPSGFDIFHNVEWSSTHHGRQTIGEVDIAIVSPEGHLLLIEVKAGPVDETDGRLTKRYANDAGEPRDIGRQVRRHHTAMLARLQRESLSAVRIGSLLLLPDHRLVSAAVGHDREQIVDAGDLEQIGQRVRQALPSDPVPTGVRQRLIDFLSDRYAVVPDVAAQSASSETGPPHRCN